MKHLKIFSRNRIQSGKSVNRGIVLDSIIIHKFFWGLLLLAYSCFAAVTLASAEEARSDAWREAFALIDKGERRRAVSKLEGLLQSDLPESDKLKIHHVLGYNYEKLRNRPKAVGHYARVASLSYALADCAVYRLAQLYESMNNSKRAIKWYTQLVKDYPASFYSAEAKWALGQLHLEQKAYETAKSYLVDLLKHPQYAREATFAFARCDEALGNVSAAFDTFIVNLLKKSSPIALRKSHLVG